MKKATGWAERRGALEAKREALESLTEARGDFVHTNPSETLLEARRAFQERNKPLLAAINQRIKEAETFHKQNPRCLMTPEERQDLFDLYETREFVATAHLHIPVNVQQGMEAGLLIGTTFMPLGKFVAEGPRQVAKAFSATSKMIRAAEVHATRMLNLQKGKSALLKIPGMSFKQKEVTSHFGSVLQELKAEFVQGTQKSVALEALGLETRGLSRGLISKSHSELPSLSKEYFREMEKRSGIEIVPQQRRMLKEAVQSKRWEKLQETSYNMHTSLYTKGTKTKIIAEWEKNTGQKWPTYQKWDAVKNKFDTINHQIHHIIPQQVDGPHEWWNVHPLLREQHQSGVHLKTSVLNQLLKDFK